MSHSSGTDAVVISPFVTQYSPNAYINIDASLNEIVNVTGIDRVFTKSLVEAAAKDFLNGFNCSGYSVDCRLANKDYDFSDLIVALETTGEMGDAFRGVIVDAIDTAVDSTNAKIDKWLATQLRAAFLAAFGSALPTSSIAGTNDADANNGSDPAQTAQNTDPAMDTGAGDGTVSITLTTQINGFTVDVLTDTAVAANNLITGHNTNAGALASMFRQCRRERMDKYLPEGAAGATEVLSTAALPLTKGDSVEFIFDIDVTTAGAQAGAPGAENVPTVGSQSTSYGTSSFSLNMANRRVALKLNLVEGGDGSAFTGLRAAPAAPATPGNPANSSAAQNTA